MKKGLLTLATILLISASTALACHITGTVSCPNQFPVPGVTITAVNAAGVSGSAVTDAQGVYWISLPTDGPFTVTLDVSTLPPNSSVLVSAVVNTVIPPQGTSTVDWSITGDACGVGCWFTGGGALVDPLIGIPVATQGGPRKNPVHSFGGNVNPGCSPTAGDGGSWNHVARGNIKLHFHGTHIEVVECGNVTPPPDPGSTSPVTPFNYIIWQGTGTLKGIGGKKVDYGEVSFLARTEDRNEPGSTGPSAGAYVDRYYLRVWETADPSKTTLLLISGDPTHPENVVPTPITDGNFQLHISSCDKPPKP